MHIGLILWHASANTQVSDNIDQDVALRGNCAFDRPFNLLSFLKDAFMLLMRKLLPANHLRPDTTYISRQMRCIYQLIREWRTQLLASLSDCCGSAGSSSSSDRLTVASVANYPKRFQSIWYIRLSGVLFMFVYLSLDIWPLYFGVTQTSRRMLYSRVSYV